MHPQNYFMIFGQPFENAAAYLDLVADAVRVQIEAAQMARAERGEAPFPPVPPELAAGKPALALESYARSEKLCRMYEHFPRWKSVLDKQTKLYDDAGKLADADRVRAERRRVDALERQGGSGKKPSELADPPAAQASA